MLKAAIFDLDGVLADSHGSHVRAWNSLLWDYGRQLTETDVDLLREGRKKEELMRALLGELSENEMQTLSRKKDLLLQQEMKSITAVAGVEPFLQELDRGAVPMAVASCGSGARVHQTLGWLCLKKYFHVIVTGDDVATGKTSPKIFCKAAQKLGAEPNDVVVFEDSTSGIEAATSAGMKCVGIANGARAHALLRAGAIMVLPDFASLSQERLGQFLALKMRDYETTTGAGAVEHTPFAVLEDC